MDSLPRLPQEIFDIIIDDNSYDQTMHKTLALVSKSFLFRSRKHFFREIEFQDDDGKCRALQSRFWEILNANRDIASYVRKVYVLDYHDDYNERLFEDDGKRPSWILEEETFQGILLELAKNQIMDLTLDINYELDWTTFPAGLQHALTQILTTPSLKKLDLSNIQNLPTSSCTHFPRLEYLRISGITLVKSENYYQRGVAPVSISSLVVTRLQGISVQLFFRNVLGLGTTDTSLPFLETLGISFCDAWFMREVTRTAQKSLRSLILTTRGRDIDVVHLSELESLKCLVLKSFHHENFETGILGVLETGGPNNELRSMQITLFQSSYHILAEYFSRGDTGIFWRSLATILNRFSGLMDLVIELAMHGEDSDPEEEQRAALERSVRDGLFGGGGDFASLKRVLSVRISVL